MATDAPTKAAREMERAQARAIKEEARRLKEEQKELARQAAEAERRAALARRGDLPSEPRPPNALASRGLELAC
jgi:hypothetical protein